MKDALGSRLEFDNHVKTAVHFLEETYGYCQHFIYERPFCIRLYNIFYFGYEILVPGTEEFTLPYTTPYVAFLMKEFHNAI